MVEATGLSSMESGHRQCHHLHTKFHPNPPIGSKVAHKFEAQTSAILEWLKLRD
jgi:hypothetical protein